MSQTSSPILLLADSRPLFSPDERRKLIAAIATTVEPERATAAYVGAANGDDPSFYTIFEAAMDGFGVPNRRMIPAGYSSADAAYLRCANIILLAGGDAARGWRGMTAAGITQDIVQRHADGAVLIGVSAGAVLIGQRGCAGEDPERWHVFDTLSLVPWIVDAHGEPSWARLRHALQRSGGYARGLGLPAQSAAIYHRDGTLEVLRRSFAEFVAIGSTVMEYCLVPTADAPQRPE